MRNIIISIVIVILLFLSGCKDESNNGKLEVLSDTSEVVETEIFNHLKDETSPYLQQHATNPVDWYPYSDEAFEKALDENKMIFLSIGYSTCHWCHVMKRESFEDEEIAAILNENYISIKVDREERPDIDSYYMTLYQNLSGNGGWPLNIILTPDQKMFYGATYLPKDSVDGQIGLIDTLTYLQEIWVTETDKILDTASNMENISNELKVISKGISFDDDLFESVMKNFELGFDPVNGGFSTAPKFPTPHYLEFLLDNGNETQIQMVLDTLDHIISGGITDQIGGGFHRYTIDSKWEIPHFEKMLYDQAGIINILSKAYTFNENDAYEAAILNTINFVDSTLSNGDLYYSAIDAESEHEEGKFYIWSLNEIESILTNEEFEFAKEYYSLSEKGNYLDELTNDYNGLNILYRTTNKTLTYQTNSTTNKLIGSINNKLLEVRSNRIEPQVDKKILSDWNAMYIESMFLAGKALENDVLVEKAISSL